MTESVDHMCQWISDEPYWSTTCGHAFAFTCDGIKENGFEFCPYCGKPIREFENVSELLAEDLEV